MLPCWNTPRRRSWTNPFAIPRRRDLSLRGTPETWDLHGLLMNFTTDPELSPDRLTLERVLQGRKLLMPAEQLMQPRDPQHDEIADMHFDEGMLEWIKPEDVEGLHIPETDREVMWPLVKDHKGGFFMVHIHCAGGEMRWELHESFK